MKTHFFNLPLRFATALCLLLLAAAHPAFGAVTYTGDAFDFGPVVVVGMGGQGSLTIDGGSSLSKIEGYVGLGPGNGTVNVNGGNWTNSNDLYIAESGTGSLTITNGTVSNANGRVGYYAGSNGTVNMSGGTWTNSSALFIGSAGNGTLNLTGNGTVSVGGGGLVNLAQTSGSIGTLNLGNGTTAGTLSAATITGGSGTAVVNINQSGSYSLGSNMTDSLSLNHLGTGTTTLTGTNTNTGGTTISAGTLLITGSTSAVTINSGTLGGTGTVGDVVINSGGAIAPGNSPGTLTTGNMTWNGGGFYNWELASANGTAGMDWDLISSSGTLTIGANATNKFTIRLASYGSGSLSGVKIASWEIGNFTTGITGFSNDYFTFNATGMSGSAGSYSLSLGGGNTTLLLNYASAGSVWSTGSGNWTTATQWEGNTLPTNGDAIEFSGPGGTSTNNFASGNLSEISGVTFTSTANGSYTINGNALTIGADGIVNNSNSTQTVAINLTLGTNQTFASNTANLVISGNISGNASLTKAGNQTLTLSGTNTYSGGTIVSAGMLAGTTSSLQGAITNNSVVNFDQMTSGTYAGAMSGNGSLLKTGSGTVTISGTNTYTGGTTISGGTLSISNNGRITHALVDTNIGNGTLNLSSGSISNARGDIGVNAGSRGVATVSGGNWTNTGNFTVGNSGDGTLNLSGGLISNTGFCYIGLNAGSTGVANVSGGNWTNADQLQIGVLGTGTLNITGGNVSNAGVFLAVENGSTGVVNVSGGTWSSSDRLRVGRYGNGTLNLTGGNVSIVGGAGNLTVATQSSSTGILNIGNGTTVGNLQAARVAAGNGTAIVNFNHTGNHSFSPILEGNLTVNKLGAGTTILTGNSTYTGGTFVSSGTLQGNTQSLQGAITNNASLVFNQTTNGTYTGVMSGSGDLSKIGNATLTLSGNSSSFNGTAAINSGIVSLTGSMANASTTINNGGTLTGNGSLGAVTINSGGILTGNGTAGVVTINSGGAINPGNSPGILTVGNSVWNGGGIYNWELASANGTAGTGWDLIASAGTLTLNATSGNPTTISLSTLGGASLAGVKNASWQIGNFTSGISGFDASAFTFNSSNMTGTAGGYFMSLGSGNTTLLLNYKTAATWNTATGNWSTEAQWDGGSLPSNGDAIEFSGSGGVSTNNSFLNSASGLTFLAGAGSYTVNGSALTLLGEGIVNDSANTQTLALDLTLGANQTFATNTANLIVSGAISGNASLTKAGNKTLTLLGSNTYTGGTTVSSGILAGTTAGLQGAIANNAVVNFDQSFTGTYAGVMSGNGSLLKTGSGTVTISGTNSYTGGTQLDGGVLEALHANALGNGTLTLSSGTLAVGNTANPNLVLSGMTDLVWLSSNAVISLAHGGNITISGNFSNGGNTGNRTLDFGTGQSLQLGNNTLVSFGATNFSASNFVAAISGSNSLSGSFQIIGNSLVYNLQGANVSGNVIDNSGAGATPTWVDFTVNGNTGNGTVITAGGNNTIRDLAFTNNGNLAIQAGYALSLSQGQVAVENGNSVVSGGTLATPGNFNKTGAGELDVQSTLSVNGTASIDAGLLSLNGNLTANSVAVNSGAILGGSGTIFAPVTVSGNLAPGNSPGTLSMASLALTPTAATDIEIESLTNFDRLVVGGAATVDGTLNVIPYNGNPLAYGQQYSFLVASGGISGEFDTITAPATFRGRFLNLGTTGILLIAPDSYTQVAVTPNQQNVAKALDSFIAATSGDRETVSIALDLQTAEQYPYAFEQIMPGFYESLANIAIEQTYNQTQLLTQRMGSVRLGATGFQAIGMSQPIKYDKDGKSAADAKTASPIVESAIDTNWNSWVIANGEFSLSRGLAGVPNYNNNAGGFLVGADYRLSENFAAGLFAGYEYSYAKYDGGSSTRGNSALFGLYGSYTHEDGYYADAIVSGGYTGFQTRRSIEFSTIDRTPSADPNSGQFSAALNLGKDFEIGNFTLGPIVGAQYTYAGIGGFTESGADSLDLALGHQNANSLRTNLGARIAYNWEVGSNITLIPEVRGFWMHEFLNNPRNISSALEGGSGPSFDYETSAPYRNSVFGGAGISAKFGDRWNGSVFYNVNFGAEGYTNNIISTSLGFSF
ncbi:MAG: autotransporter domain-containing protein [Verrucomicrobia bacterium]|nr:autotransporter domain-containing protein [Verrucomicrobiota bacterium]